MSVGLRVSILAAVTACGLWAQAVAGAGAVSGYVFTGVDDALPQVQVTVSNTAFAVKRTAVTSDEGFFEITGLPPGSGYKVKVELKGYATFESPVFEVAVGRTHVVTLGMQRPGGEPTKGETYRLVPHVESNKLGITNRVSPQEVISLPSNDRKLDSLVALAPLVSFDAVTGRVMFLGETKSNSFLHDGITTTNGYFENSAPGIAGPLTLESVQEFQTLAANYPAEFGRAIGGVVNAVTPAGPSAFHGGAFDYLRPSSFSSRQRFALGQSLLGQRNQAGANFGGPILKDRVMFFVNFEHLNDDFQGMNRITSQTLADSAGQNVVGTGCTATVAQCAAAIKFIQGQMNVVSPLKQHWTSGLGRVDYRRSEKNTFNAEFNAMNQSSPDAPLRNLVAPNGGLLGLNNSTEDTRFAKGAWIWNPRSETINELHIGMFQDKWFAPASTPGLSTGNVGITVGGVTVGNPNPNAQRLDERRYQLVDTLTITSGTHTIRVGGDISRTHDEVDMLQNGGMYNYANLTNFAQDFSGAGTARTYTNFMQQFGTSAHMVPYREVNTYAQDTWRGIPRLNFTFGVRWDRAFLPQPSVSNTTYYQTGTISASNIAFSPRVGLAFRLGGDTVLRAGYGFFYAPYPGQFIDDLLQGNGLSQTWASVNPNFTGAPIFPNLLTFTTAPTGSTNLMYAQSKLRNPHTQQATISIERHLARGTTITLSGVNSRATKLWTGTDQNLTLPVKTGTYPIDNASGAVVGSYATSVWTSRNDNRFAQIFQVGNGGSEKYYAGSVELRHQMSHGLTAQLSYTWSQATGTQTGPLYAGAFPLMTNPTDLSSDKGKLPTDQRNRAVLNWVWQPVITHGNSIVERYFVNGWRLSGIASLTSGQPLTPTLLLSGNQFSGLTMDYFTSLNGSGGWGRAPFAPIGSYKTDTLRSVDARLSRSFPFTERVHAEVAFEALNLANTQRITGLNTIGYMAVAVLPVNLVNGPYNGVIKPVPGGGSGNASSGYPDGTSARQLQLAIRFTF